MNQLSRHSLTIYVVSKGPIKKNRIVLLDQIPQLPRRAVWCLEGWKLPRRVILLLEEQINFKFELPTSFGSVTNIIIIQAGCQRWRRKKENAQEQHLVQSATKDQKSALFIAEDLKIFWLNGLPEQTLDARTFLFQKSC